MEFKSLILGVLFSIGVFAVKSGVGLYYCIEEAAASRTRRLALAGFAAVYLLLFAAAFVVLRTVDMIEHLPVFLGFMRSGMMVHLLMAGMLLFWGVRLLREGGARHRISRGWILLATPCPVCAAAILMSMGLLFAAMPDRSIVTTAWLYLMFLSVSLSVVFILRRANAGENQGLETLLGGAMVLIAAYFLLSVVVIPQFADAENVYRLALATAEGSSPGFAETAGFFAATAVAFGVGFALKTGRIRRTS